MDSVSVCGVLAWLVLHVVAIGAAWATRVAVGSRAEGAFQLCFFLAMATIGVTAVIGHVLELGRWSLSVATLIVMVLTAVTDFRRTHEPAHMSHPMIGR